MWITVGSDRFGLRRAPRRCSRVVAGTLKQPSRAGQPGRLGPDVLFAGAATATSTRWNGRSARSALEVPPDMAAAQDLAGRMGVVKGAGAQ